MGKSNFSLWLDRGAATGVSCRSTLRSHRDQSLGCEVGRPSKQKAAPFAGKPPESVVSGAPPDTGLTLGLMLLGGAALRGRFEGLGSVLSVAGDLQLQVVAVYGAFIFGHHGVAIHLALHGKRNVVAVHFAVHDFGRGRRIAATAAKTGNTAGQLGAILLQGHGHGPPRPATPPRLLIGPLAGYVRSHKRERGDKQNGHYKKQLFGHSVRLGVGSVADVTRPVARRLLSLASGCGKLPPGAAATNVIQLIISGL